MLKEKVFQEGVDNKKGRVEGSFVSHNILLFKRFLVLSDLIDIKVSICNQSYWENN